MKKIVALVLSLVMVLGLATTAFAATTYSLYACENDEIVAGKSAVAYTKVAAKEKTDGTGTVAYVEVDGSKYFEIAATEATKADFYLTVTGSETAVMYLKAATKVDYIGTAKEFTNFGYGCGQYTKQYGDTSKYYEVTSGTYKYGLFQAGTAGQGFLVDGKVVQLDTQVYKNTHVWSATAVDNTTGVPTAAICGKCSATGVVYASTAKVPAAAVVDVTPLTYNNVNYPVVAGAVASAPTVDGDKVESAETFDAGIAMYVGMSVMAAAGSAVVLKKKD